MRKLFATDQRGMGHVGIIVAVVVILAVGGIGYFVWQKNKDSSSSPALSAEQQAALDASFEECKKTENEDLCKYYRSVGAPQQYTTIVTTTESDGVTSKMTIQSEGTDKSYTKLEGETTYESITIGNSTYTRTPDGTWWKQTQQDAETTEDDGNAANFDFPDITEDAPTTPTIRFEALGKEACDNRNCFKFRATDESGAITIWFDDKDYLLRQMTMENDGGTTQSIYSYDKVTIKEPSPVKELGPNQYLVPGQSEPTTLPNFDDYNF